MNDREDKAALGRCLRTILEDVFHENASIAGIQSQLCEYSSTFRSYVISVALRGGKKRAVFLKDFGSSEREVPDLRARRNRELLVYRDLLPGSCLGNPRYYGSVWDEPQQRFWLLLEFVEATPIGELGFDRWLDAVRWLGRLHGFSVENDQRVQQSTWLVRHDRSFFERTAVAANRALSHFPLPLAQRLGAVVSTYAPLIDAMVRQPPVLVHGSYGKEHILLDSSAEPRRVCPVDWESAALGASLFDLAYLIDGFGSPVLDDIIAVYREALSPAGTTIPATDEVMRLLNCYLLHRTMSWLSRASSEQFPEPDIAHLVTRAEALTHAILQ